MNAALKQFDTRAARLVTRLPQTLNRPFELLAYPTVPLGWAIVLTMAALLGLSDQPAANLAVLAAVPLASLIKFAFRRQRPPTIYAGGMRIKSYSFPSSHAYSSALGGVFLACIAWQNAMPWLSGLVLMLPLVIGISRIYVGAHYPSDVLVGWLMGGVIALGAIAVW